MKVLARILAIELRICMRPFYSKKVIEVRKGIPSRVAVLTRFVVTYSALSAGKYSSSGDLSDQSAGSESFCCMHA
jgi:hypothetical protein